VRSSPAWRPALRRSTATAVSCSRASRCRCTRSQEPRNPEG
jgi:hypothetical protein